ncbi:PEGA domain-containing protein [Oleiharenicola lentus]|nr:PEGA domain-containing protein [Oleiharenicola lentus]
MHPHASPSAFGQLAVSALCIVLLLAAGCSKSPEEQRAVAKAEKARTTGALTVKSNLPAATFTVAPVTSGTETAPAPLTGSLDQPLGGLPPGKYAVTLRADGWPEIGGQVDVTAGQTAEIALNFKSGSLKLESEPTGATVKLGATALGKTPLTIPMLPPGDCTLTLELPSWPALAFKTTITEDQEATATARLPHGKLTVASLPTGANLLIGGKVFGQTPVVWQRMPAGTKKLTLQAKDFPPLELTVNVTDGADVTITPELGAAFPLLDARAILADTWVPDDPNRLTASFEITGRFAPKNGIVKNLKRQRLHENWLTKRYRYSGTVKAYDPKSGEIEFNEETADQSRYRIVATPTPTALAALNLNEKTAKGVTLNFYGQLTGVEEPRWPSKVITFELTSVELLKGDAP